MALSIEKTAGADRYDIMQRGGIDNVITMYSTNYGQPSFRYIVEIVYSNFYGDSKTIVNRIQPNPYGRGILNMRQILMEALWTKVKVDNGTYPYIFNRNMIDVQDSWNGTGITVNVYEGWNVSGVFTQDPNSIGAETISVMGTQGFRNALELPVLNSPGYATKGYQDADENTFKDRLNWLLPDNLQSSTSIYMPCTISNYGHLTFNADNGVYCQHNTNTDIYAEYAFYDITGTLITTDTSKWYSTSAGCQAYVPSYPQSIQTILGGWDATIAFYTIQLKEDKPGTTVCSSIYTFVIEEEDCRHDNVHLAWMGRNGAWQFFNFIKRNEISIEVDRKQFTREYGNYGTLGKDLETIGAFQTNQMDDRGIISREPNVTQFIEINSDWITEKEFEYLKHMVTSEHVRLINHLEQGISEPLVLTDNSFVMRRERNNNKYNATFKFKYSKSYAAINYEVPVPDKKKPTCVYYDLFVRMGGNTPFTLSSVGTIARVNVTSATGGYIRFSVNSSVGNVLIPGQSYKVNISKVGGAITPVLSGGHAWFGLGIASQTTGSGGTIGTFTDAELPVSMNVVCGSFGLNFYLRLPSLSSPFTGHFDITIGEGSSC
jgi:hypothetical protein